ncbi:MAG: FecCD family ABC transporter permease [Dermatophilaceae bacterium]
MRAATDDDTTTDGQTIDGRPAGAATDHVSRRLRSAGGMAALVAVTVAAVAASVGLGPVVVPPDEAVRVLVTHLAPGAVNQPPDPLFQQIVWDFRLPRALLGAVVGAGLALVGAVLQAAVRNPLADPYLLGVSSGAAAGAVLALTLSLTSAGLTISGAAFAGALVATAALYALARRGGRVTPTRFVLAGVALAYLFQAIYSYLLISTDPRSAQSTLFWLLGSLGSADWSDLGLPAAALVAGSIALLARARSLNALIVGDEIAVSLGLDVNRLRLELLLLTSLLVGVMVSVSGAIAFVGLIVPHAVRFVVGSDHRRLLPVSALVGASFLVIVDLVARTVAEPTEVPLTVVTSLVGVPFFLWLLRRRERGREGIYG